MCLILLAINPDDRYRLVVAANRDELYKRPTRDACFWPEEPTLLAGRDENMGGTWLGVNRQGHFAAVTNFRETPPDPVPPGSRGELPTDFLLGDIAPESYCDSVRGRHHNYRGFNMLVADNEQICYQSNRTAREQTRVLEPGFYGLSNQLLDCDWPKVIEGREKLAATIRSNDLTRSLFELLVDEGDDREFSNSFISSDQYGTRAATVVTISHDGDVYFEERNFGPGGKPVAANKFEFNCIDGS